MDFERTVGLFGTCGRSTWRDPLKSRLQAEGIPYFDPQVPEGTWHPGLIPLEHRHLTEDGLVVFAITEETTAHGSLAEVGFSILAALRSIRSRSMVYYISDACEAEGASPAQIEDSVRTRALVKSRLAEEARTNPRLYVCHSLSSLPSLVVDVWTSDEAGRETRALWMSA